MRFSVDGKLSFEVPFSDIGQSVIQGKNEISLEFQEDDTVDPGDDVLTEMRLYIPPGLADASAPAAEGEEPVALSAIEGFQKQIMDRASLGESSDETIASFDDVLFITPRGRYDVEMYANYLSLHGKSFSYKIMYKSINRLFLLPRPNSQTTLVVSLNPAIRQGQTSYPFLQMAFKDEDEIELKPNMDPYIALIDILLTCVQRTT
jgi:structure-specific recognition protein 1